MAWEGAFEEGGDVLLFFGGELVDGFELESQHGHCEMRLDLVRSS
ncbi:hypothetical protein LY41_003311 [Prauserella halophila]|nr:hypothetical protein [Prauserella halophila]